MKRTAEIIYSELLVIKCQDGDDLAFRELYDIWAPRFLRHISRLLTSSEAAIDPHQEGWLAISKNIKKLRDPATFPAWGYRIMTSKTRNWQRKQITSEKTAQNYAVKSPADGEHAKTAQQEDDVDLVRKSMASISEDKRLIITLFYYEGLSIQEIAQALDIVEGTVKSRLYHARQEIKHIIERNS